MAIDLLNGLISYWKLDEPGGVRYDAHGPNHLTAVNNPGSAAGQLGNAADFVAANSEYLSVNNSVFQMTGPMTFAGWVYISSTQSDTYPTVLGKWSTTSEYLINYSTSTGKLQFQVVNAAATQKNVTVAITTNAWNFFTAWYDGTNINLSVNNGTAVSTALADSPRTYTTPFRIGSNTGSRYINGAVDAVGVWNRALTTAEITALYNGGAGLPYHRFYDGLAATWSFALRLGSTWTDISDYVIDANWQIGFTEPYEVMARAETLGLTVRNTDRRFSPEYAAGPYYGLLTRNTPVRVQCAFAGQVRDMFFGQIDAIEPAGDTRGNRLATLSCGGVLARLQNIMVNITAQEGKRADEVAATILNDASLTANASGVWLLGVVGVSELGVATELGDQADILEPETGVSTLIVIGDRWGDETSAYGALKDVAGQEYGRIFVSRAGRVKFWNRHHFILHPQIDDFVSDGDLRGLAYAFGDDVLNEVIVAARPRVISSGNEVLAKLDAQSVLIKRATTKSITFRYEDASTGASIGGKNVIAPQKITDYTANSLADGSGVDMLGDMSATIADESGTSCRVDFQNASTDTDVWLQPGAQVRGIKITDFGQIESRAIDQTSIDDYGLKRWRYGAELDDVDVAQSMADFILSQRRNPAGLVKSVSLAAHASGGQMYRCLAGGIGTKISLSEQQTDTGGDYFIIGESWRLANREMQVTWQLASAATNNYWILGLNSFAELGIATLLGPL